VAISVLENYNGRRHVDLNDYINLFQIILTFENLIKLLIVISSLSNFPNSMHRITKVVECAFEMFRIIV